MEQSALIEKIEEIALMVVMFAPGDDQAAGLIRDLINDFCVSAKDLPDYPRLEEACRWMSSPERAGESLADEFSKFVSAAQQFVTSPDRAVFPNETQETGWGNDLSEHADGELIVEFIEKHSSLLDEYEAKILEVSNTGVDSEDSTWSELLAFVKSYLHNVKGDAGSVGLLGVERCTHSMEELLGQHSIADLVDSLLEYKEWVLAVMTAYTSGGVPNDLSESFLARMSIHQSSGEEMAGSIDEEPPVEEVPSTVPTQVIEEVEEATSNGDVSLVQEVLAPKRAASPLAGMEPYQISGDLEILTEFLLEAEDHLGAVEQVLLEKESGYTTDDLDAIFRAVHSIKGGSSYFNLKEIMTSSHTTENLMDKARSGRLTFNTALKAIVLRFIDVERILLERAQKALENDGQIEPYDEVPTYLESIEDYLRSIALMEELEKNSDCVDESVDVVPVVEQENIEPSVEEEVPVMTKTIEPKVASESAVSTSQNTEGEKSAAKKGPKQEKVELKTFVKVDTNRLDHLIEYIGEMVISSSMLIQNCRDLLGHDDTVMGTANQLERISKEIQEIGMSMRLIPIKGLFQKMSRVVWDTAKKVGKDIKFEMEGEETELDRSVIDRLADPLMHMVRNAVDHGVEAKGERDGTGKPPAGIVKLSAFHSGGSIFIEIRDDGRGLDPQKLRDKAVEKGIIDAEQVLTDEEAYMLIFAAGFSTAAQVTDVSGRGVGMDVVRRNIESMRGRISINSELGRGSVFTIELPLTLAIAEGIEVSLGNERYIIPTLSVVEVIRPTSEMLMDTMDRGETLRFRGSFLPIFRVANLYDIPDAASDPADGTLVIVENGGRMVALQVDEVVGKLSVVIKGLGDFFEQSDGISGCAIMPNGLVGLILDIPSLIALAQRNGDGLEPSLPRGEARIQAPVH